MKKRIPYIAAFIWMMFVGVLAFMDGRNISLELKRSSYHDGYMASEKIYLVENIKEQGVLYMTDLLGKVQSVTTSASIWQGSFFGKVDYKESLFAVLTKMVQGENGDVMEYRIVRFDDQDLPAAQTKALRPLKDGILTGFSVEDSGCYLTFVMDQGKAAGVYFVGLDDVSEPVYGNKEESESRELKLYELEGCEDKRRIIEARYEDGTLLIRKDDGTGAEAFEKPAELDAAFANRSLSDRQGIKLWQYNAIFYVQLLFVGYFTLVLVLLILRNRNHTAYTIAIVEAVLLAVTVSGASFMPYIRAQERADETRQFGFYYLQVLTNVIDTPVQIDFDNEAFYNESAYYKMQSDLAGFVRLQEVSDIFLDICLVRSSDHKVLVSTRGYNGQRFEQIYTAGSSELLDRLADGESKIDTLIYMDGDAYQVLGTAASGGLNPEYLLLGVARQEEAGNIFDGSNRIYLICAEILFLAGSVVGIFLLLLQSRELKSLVKAMQAVADDQSDVEKVKVHGKDVEYMWNSLMEIQKIIRRINYTRYRIFESCYRFAPKNIEKILGKDSITEVKGGDMILVHGTVAVISSVEPGGSGQVPADLINRFITLAERHQEASGGFFVSGHSDLMLLKVLFLEDSRNTVDFGVSFQHEFQENRTLDALKTGLLLHYSQYMYGVAGTPRQSFPFLLSKEIQELERYAEWFREMGMKLVITEAVKNREKPADAARYIGYILISDTGERLRMYEVLDACPAAERRLKAETDRKFQNAIELFYRHDFYLARSMFSDVLKENPADCMAKWYLFTCEEYLNAAHTSGDICRLDRETRFVESEL